VSNRGGRELPGLLYVSQCLVQHKAAASRQTPPTGLPKNLEAEQTVLGVILLDSAGYLSAIRSLLEAGDFSLSRHERIYRRALELDDRGVTVNSVTLGEELEKHSELKGVGGLGFLNSLNDGLPQIKDIGSYVRVIQEKAMRRRIIFGADALAKRALLRTEDTDGVIAAGAEFFDALRAKRRESGPSIIENLPPVWSYQVNLEWIWDEIVAKGTVNLFTGESGGGKSTFMLKLSAVIASGGMLLGRAVEQRRVLYIDGENPLNVIKDRLSRLRIPENPQLTIWGCWNRPKPHGPGSAEVLRFAERHQPFLVFDSKKAFDGGDEQDATATRRHMDLYRRLTTSGATVALLHNTGKTESAKEYRGSSDVKASVDSAYLLERTDGSDSAAPLGGLRLKPFKSRLAPSKPIRFSYADGEFTTTEAAPRSACEILEDLLRAHPLSTQRRLIQLAQPLGIAKSKVAELLLKGHQEGKFDFQPGRSGSQKWYVREPVLQ
jgi:hypothetical protein